jgi:hypothetical protein
MRSGAVKRAGFVGLDQEHCQVVRRVTPMGSRGRGFWVTLLVGSYMPVSIKSMIARGCLTAIVLWMAACSPRRIPPLSVSDLMEDRVVLDGVLMKCNQNPTKARTDTECLNARIAIDRLASRSEPAEEAKRAEEFEKNREQLRLTQEKQRQEEAAKIKKVDVYHMPVIPVDPAPPPKDPQSPIVGKTNP